MKSDEIVRYYRQTTPPNGNRPKQKTSNRQPQDGKSKEVPKASKASEGQFGVRAAVEQVGGDLTWIRIHPPLGHPQIP